MQTCDATPFIDYARSFLGLFGLWGGIALFIWLIRAVIRGVWSANKKGFFYIRRFVKRYVFRLNDGVSS